MSNTFSNLKSFCHRHEGALWLLAIITLAVVLRLKGLSFQSYWYDELFSAHNSNPRHSFDEVLSLTLADVHPPLFQLVMWGFYKVFGYNEWAGRLPSALAGIATIPVMYMLGRELFGRRVGLYAAALATPNFYLVSFSQEARSYAFLYFLCCLSFLFFVRALASKSWANALLYAAVTTALVYTHYFGFVLVTAQGIILILYLWLWQKSDRSDLIRALVAIGLVAVALLPLLPGLLRHANISNFWIEQPANTFVYDYFLLYFNSPWLAGLFALLLAIALSVGVLRPLSPQQGSWIRFGITALVVWIAVGYLLPWVRGLIGQPVLTDRNTIMVVPPLLILAAYGLASLPGLTVQRVAGVGLLLLSVFSLVVDTGYYNVVRKNQYREMAAELMAYEHVLPVYTLKFNDTKYNVYFEQLGSPLLAEDASVLEEKLLAGSAEPLFWMADALRFTLQTDLEERFGLVQVALYKYMGVVAELLVNPEKSTPIPLEPAMIFGTGGNWHSEGPVVWRDEHDQLLVALHPDARTDPARNVQVDLLDAAGNILESHMAQLGMMPSTVQIDPDIAAGDAVRLLIRLPVGEPQPSAWLIPRNYVAD